jgi:signal peptidase I
MEQRWNGDGTPMLYNDARSKVLTERDCIYLRSYLWKRRTQKGDGTAMHQTAPIEEETLQEVEVQEPDNQEPENAESQEELAPDPQKTKEQKETVKRFLIKLLVVLLVVWAIFTFVFGIRQVSGESMYPRLRDGDLILYYRLEQDYQIGDVVTFKEDGQKLQGRIVAQGGDVVELEDGNLVVNGNAQDEEIFYNTYEEFLVDVEFPYTVEEGSYFVLSDFRTNGYDSRSFGAVSQKDLDGKVITLLRRRGI